MAELEPAHSPLGPSSAERWLQDKDEEGNLIGCPGSVLATIGVVETPSKYAAEGTVAHTVAEIAHLGGFSERLYKGQVYAQDGFDIPVTQEMVDAVEFFLDYVADLGGETFCETRVYYREYVKDGFGTMDRASVLDDTAHIVDFKYGEGVQKWAKNNPQLKLYALGWYLLHNWLYDVKKFVLHIVQPRLGHTDKWEISVEDLLKWAEEVVRAGALLTQDPNAPIRAGEWCQFCRIKRTCRVRAESVFKTALGDFEDLDQAMQTAPRVAASLSNDEVAKALDALPQLTQWIKDIKDHAAFEVRHGRAVGTYKFVAGKGSREFGKPEAEVVALIKERKPDVDTATLYTKPALLSVAKIEEVVGKTLWKPATAKKPAGPLVDLIKKNAGAPTLVHGSDPRPALTDLTEEFENLDANEDFLNT